jgi:hypothetical protein
MKRGKVNWTDNILRRSCRLIHITEGKLDGKERGGRRSKQLPDNSKEKEDAVNRKRKH